MKRFKQLDDECFHDYKTGLLWRAHTEKGLLTWQEAMALETNEWRLPTVDELRGVLSKKLHAAVYSRLPNTGSGRFWSSSTYSDDCDLAWIVNFDYGDFNARYKGNRGFVRMVRR